ncbi:AHH domain-containing protein [Cellulophaga sp. HaHaR_3_176]|uniref:AHH domain-containing protein n=1 Tax=Cellulophaga sp. HaHaR_3_176 TaxID=1942464 RepID=UPI001C1FACD9|nr:AHH domain-containing protein [Cellulophaga sp. HaHaR_3_176]QWX83309.1 AHH domain-containing protein [Cellulophaga sp. HaHaR_3_176]
MKKNKTYTNPKSVFATIFRCKQGLLFSLFYFFITGVFAQNFPVQIIPQATPPPPIYLSNYADASTVNSPLRVQIILNDLNIQSREVRLKVYFQGSGLTFESNDFVTGASPLFLEGGSPLILTNVELAPYFKFENITGISPNVYGNSIPEGTYQFCFEIFDVATGNRLSRKSCVTSVIFKNEPPFLISPRNKDNIAETNPQNIVFQWTPRSINVTNVEYELSLVEIWDTQIDPQAAFLSSPPIFQTTTTSTTYVFGPSDPLLLSGKNYAWRVQAKAKQGIEEIGLFKNQGYSEIFSFSHASACDLPLSINHEVKGSTITNIFWDDFSNEVPEYTVRYRKKGNNNDWFYNKTSSNTTSLWDLKAGTTYEYQIRKKCSVTESDWSITKQFTTHIADNEESVYECGITPNFTLSNTEPLATIENGEKFTAGDFPIHVLEVSGSNGRFTGKGYVTIPYLNSIRVGVKFTNILINTDKQMAEGTVITMYDPSLKNLLDVDDAIETVSNAAEAVGELFEGDNDLDEIRVNFDIPKDKYTDYISVKDGIVTITNPANGATETSPLGDDKVIVDKSGQTYHIDAGGAITPGGQIDPSGSVTTGNVTGVSRNGDLESLTAQGIQVTFESTGIYGYDQMPTSANDKLKKEYTTVLDASGSDYTLAHIAVENKKTITVTAKVAFNSNSDYTLADLKFKTLTGELIPVAVINESNNTIDLNFTGHYTTESETIYAVVPSKEDTTKQLTAGAFTLWHLTDRVIDVVLVSVDNAPLPNTTEIAKIFKKGVATFNFETETASLKGSDALGADETLAIADNPWLTAYNDEQKALIKHIKAQFNYDKDKYYVLVFNDDFKTTKPLAGFMPLQRQFGFVFNGGLNKGEEAKGDVTTVTAHELGHGVFALQHPFTEYGTVEGSTEWLMDYKDGATGLNHMNWAQMHNPALKFYVFQDEEDGEININQTDPFADYIKSKLKELGNNFYAIIHCETGCNENNNESNYQYSEIIKASEEINSIIDGNQNNSTFFKTKNIFEFRLQFAEKASQKCMIIYYQDNSNNNNNNSSAILDNSNSETNEISKKLLYVTKEETLDCFDYLANWNSELCSYNTQNIFTLSSTPYFDTLFQVIINCINKDNNSEPIDLVAIETILKDAVKGKRDNQSVEYAKNGNVYKLDKNGTIEKIDTPLTDNEINEGIWEDASEVKIRLTHNNSGILQYQALGLNKKLNFDIAKINKTANLIEIASKIKNSANLFFEEAKIKTVTITPKELGISLNNNTQVFADGKTLQIDENSAGWKITTEALGLLTSLLKTAEIEEQTYLESTENTATIHAPGLVTGGVEVVAQKVTDLTSLCVQVTDLALNEKAREEMYNQFYQIKTQIGEDPSTFFPILVDVTIAATTGNSTEEWKETLNKETDIGRRNHKVTFGTGNAVVTVMAGAAIVKDLPEIIEKLGEKIDDILKIGNKVFKSADEFAEAIYKARNTIRKKIIDLSETKDLAKDFFEHMKKTDISLKDMSFEDWFKDTFKKYDLKGELVNFEAHHVIPADVLKNNPDLKELLFELRKTDPDFDFDFNSIDNGIMIQKKSLKLENNGHTSHKQYNDAISDKITDIISNANNPQRALDEIKDLITSTKETLKKEVLLGNKDVNDIIDF